MKNRSYVMMVDDDQMVLNVLNRIFDLEGDSTPDASCSRAIMSLLEQNKPNLVVFDITMPELEDLPVEQLVGGDSTTPVLMLTARCEVTTLRDARLLGGDNNC